jgi:ferric-dicitrate binding protein FerR (iron transport regulator)
MRRTLISLFILLFVSAFHERADAKRMMDLNIGNGEAKVSMLQGSAEVLRSGKTTWAPLRINASLRGGDEVKTGPKTRLAFVMADFTTVRFADNSHFRMLQIEAGNENRERHVKMFMHIGRGWANLSRATGRKGQFNIACDNAVAGVRGTIYHMNVEGDKSVLVRVYDGQVAVSGGGTEEARKTVLEPPVKISGPKPISGPKKVTMDEWTVIIKAMQQIRVASDGMAGKPRDFTEQEDADEWVVWNKSQDKELKTMTE